jgi:hypothetical protein
MAKKKKNNENKNTIKTTIIRNATPIEETLGWIGMLLIVLSYGLNSLLIMQVTSLTYILMNIFGSAAVFWISWRKRTYQPAALNAIWTLIGLIALVRLFM